MGHTLVQLGDSVIAYGGCSFGRVCTNELLIQKPRIVAAASNPYDCKNDGKIVRMNVHGQTHSYCQCTDLQADIDRYFTGPQCQYTTTIEQRGQSIAPNDLDDAITLTNTAAQISAQEDVNPIEEKVTASSSESLESKKKFANDGTCNELDSCNNHGICSKQVCYCDLYHTGEACETDLAHLGVRIPLSLAFYFIALVLGLITGGFVAKIYNDNRKQLFL